MASQTVQQSEAVFKQMADALAPHLPPGVTEEQVREIAADEVAKAKLPVPIEIKRAGAEPVLVEGAHQQFRALLGLVEEGHQNLLLVGPAGSGKTTLGADLAKAMQSEFGFVSLSAGVTETHLFGRMLPQADGTWGYVASPFVNIYRNGGVFLFDELDAADPNVLVSVNAALANGKLCNPISGEVIARHERTYLLGAANTWGRGADAQYCGRNALDAATLDRFCLATVFVDYDTDLEDRLLASLLPEDEARTVRGWVSTLREGITKNRLRRVASTRLVLGAAKALRAGRALPQVQRRYFQDWSTDERRKLGAEVEA